MWQLNAAFVKEIIDRFPEPKPAYNTISTIVRILEQKGFVSHESHSRSHKYFPIVSKESYTKTFISGVVKRYFSGSYQQMVSFFTNEDDISLKELEQLLDELKKNKS